MLPLLWVGSISPSTHIYLHFKGAEPCLIWPLNWWIYKRSGQAWTAVPGSPFKRTLSIWWTDWIHPYLLYILHLCTVLHIHCSDLKALQRKLVLFWKRHHAPVTGKNQGLGFTCTWAQIPTLPFAGLQRLQSLGSLFVKWRWDAVDISNNPCNMPWV